MITETQFIETSIRIIKPSTDFDETALRMELPSIYRDVIISGLYISDTVNTFVAAVLKEHRKKKRNLPDWF
jgi:hypothetical protein